MYLTQFLTSSISSSAGYDNGEMNYFGEDGGDGGGDWQLSHKMAFMSFVHNFIVLAFSGILSSSFEFTFMIGDRIDWNPSLGFSVSFLTDCCTQE